MVFHILSKEGDLKDITYVNSGESISDVSATLNALNDEEIVLFMTDFTFELTTEFRTMIESFGISSGDLDPVYADENTRKFSSIGGVFNLKGQAHLAVQLPLEGDLMHHGLKVRTNFIFYFAKKRKFGNFSERIFLIFLILTLSGLVNAF